MDVLLVDGQDGMRLVAFMALCPDHPAAKEIERLRAELIEAEKYNGWHQQAMLEVTRLRKLLRRAFSILDAHGRGLQCTMAAADIAPEIKAASDGTGIDPKQFIG